MKYVFLSVLFLIVVSLSSCDANKTWSYQSINGNIQLNLRLGDQNQLFYSVFYLQNDEYVKVIDESPLGITRDDADFVKNLRYVSSEFSANLLDQYELSSGKTSKVSYNYNQFTLTLKNHQGNNLQVVFRLFNDGVAFRYAFPDTSKDNYIIIAEETGFSIPTEGRAWMHPYADASMWGPAYERNFYNAIPIGTSSVDSIGWAFPLLFKTNEKWVFISEAGVNRNYCGSHLHQHAKNGLYKIRFPEANEAMGVGRPNPSSTLPWEMPWRFIVIADTPGGIIESTRVTDLSQPSEISNTSWIKPGRAAWSWLYERASTRDYKAQIAYIDFAYKMRWEYVLIDAGWTDMKGGTVEQVIKYANKKNVGILLWYNSGGEHNIVKGKPRDIIPDMESRRREFKRLNELGVKGIKVDFFHSDNQWMMNLYHDILQDAAENQLLVVFHGCTLPRGWSRTWPNLMSMEAVRGGECYSWDPRFPAEASLYNNILAFTRNVVGSMDYTPVTFGNNIYPHVTTYAHELALSVIFESGITHFGDSKDNFMSQPSFVVDFLKQVPTAWDETRWISGEPGTYLVLARRKNDVWFVAGINSRLKKEISFTLPFIAPDKNMYLIADGENGKEFSALNVPVCGDTIKVSMLVDGGFVGVIK